MFKPIKQQSWSSTEMEIAGLKCHIPAKGWLYNPFTSKWEYFGIERRSTKMELCYWEPDPRFQEYQKWEKEEKEKQRKDPEYIHPELEDFKRYCWIRRLSGHWFSNNGEPTYITGIHWYYLSCYHMDIGLPRYRDKDRELFYFWDYNVEDPESFGIVYVTKRRSGKSFTAGCIALEAASRSENFWAGIQSKTDEDAKILFRKTIINAYRKLPSFFRPLSDVPLTGKVPATGLKFSTGKLELDEEELMSGIDFRSSGVTAYDGQKLGYYLHDEIGKVTLLDIRDRWNVVKYCLLDDQGKIIGKSFHTTTVEEMEAGGSQMLDLWKNSNQYEKKGKRTASGLARFFVAADETRHLHPRYGIANKELARAEILEERESLKEDPRALSSAKRKEPLDEKEAFQSDSSVCVYNPILLNDRLDILKWSKSRLKKGNFQWKDGVRDTEVEFKESVNGRFLIAEMPAKPNAFEKKGSSLKPMNSSMYSAGVDPFSHQTVSKSHESRASNGAMVIFKKANPLSPTEFDMSPVLYYCNRPESPETFYEDVRMALCFYGCNALIENNKPGIIYYLEEKGCADFCFMPPDKNTRGLSATLKTTTYMAELTDQYINDHINNVWYEGLIEEWLQFDPGDTTKSDSAMAAGYALMLINNHKYNPKVGNKEEVDVLNVLPFLRGKKSSNILGKKFGF